MEKTKQCNNCKEHLPLNRFTVVSDSRKWRGPQSICKNCACLKMKENYAINPIPQMLSSAKSRAKKKNLPFDIDADYLKSIFPKDNICPVLNVPFQMGYIDENKKNRDYSPSLDRIFPEKGYIKGNLIIVCNIVNLIKSNASVEMIEKVLNFYKKFELTKG